MIARWLESDDATPVDASANGIGRGDGYDVDTYRSRRSGRYLVRATEISTGRTSWYVAASEAGARAVGAHGYTPGTGPGRYAFVANADRLAEARAT